MRITVIGAGNGGQAIAGYLSITGHNVVLYNRNINTLKKIIENGGITLKGEINGFGKLELVTDNIEKSIKNADIIMVTTTADAHKDIAKRISPFLENEQSIILNPGRTCGAIEFRNTLKENGLKKKVYVGEAQSLIYACRKEEDGIVNIIGKKTMVMFSALPSSDTDYMITLLNKLFDCFVPVENVLITSLENIGAIFHPSVVLFNAAAIERKNIFYFYQDMTPTIAAFLEKLDNERLQVGNAFGINLLSVNKWISTAYSGISDGTLYEKMKKNPAYNNIIAPTVLESRLITEDIPTGLLPISELGRMVNVDCNIIKSIITIFQELLNVNFYKTGRTLAALGLENINKINFLSLL